MPYDITVKKASEILDISIPAVHKRISSGSLSAKKINGSWKLDSREVTAAKNNAPKHGRPKVGKNYMLCNGLYDVMTFSYNPSSGNFSPKEVFDAQRAPIGTVTRNGRGSREGLRNWWEHRCIPESREGMDAKLRELGVKNTAAIPFRNLGLSLSDQYWIRPLEEEISWENINYFQNNFGDSFQDGHWDGWLSNVGLFTPDNTSEGVLSKKWVCQESERLLLKGHAKFCDQQPFNEVVATALNRRILPNDAFVSYRVLQDNSEAGAMSVCKCFINEREEYITAAAVLESSRKRKGELIYDSLIRVGMEIGISREEIERAISYMVVCDHIIANGDRHLRNFGFIRDIDTLEWRVAPLFDFGNSLWCDSDESAVGRADYSYYSRPFDSVPSRQLYFAGALKWLDVEKLNGFVDEAREILADSIFACSRLDYICEGIRRQIDTVLSLC